MSGKRCVILGAGGHAAVLIDALLLGKSYLPLGLLDPAKALWGTRILGVPVLGGEDRLAALVKKGVKYFIVGIGSVGDTEPRRRLFDWAVHHGLRPVTVVHPSAVVSPHARLGQGLQLLAASVVNARTVIEDNVLVNTGAIIEHDSTVEAHAHVASGAYLGGGVRIGSGAHIGLGARILQGITVGAGAVIGGGAVVIQNVSAGEVVAGVPARPLRRSFR